MKKQLNKIVALVVISSMLVTNVLGASSLNNILLKNTTYAGSWEDPSTGMNYYSGGGIKIKFKDQGAGFSPWAKGNVPGVNLGCNGISIEGGFLALLGLDDIERQLQNAGAAFAWGILIGLAYSLPVIGNVFERIQKWARQLQALLQNACNIGQNLSKNSPAGKASERFFQDIGINEGFAEAKEFLDDVDKKFEMIEDLAKCNDANCLKDKDNIISNWLADVFNIAPMDTTSNGSGSTSKIAKNLNDLGVESVMYKELGLDELLTTSSVYANVTEEEILNVKLSLLFFGDIALSGQTRSFISKHFNADGTLKENAFEGTGKKLITEGLQLQDAKFELLAPKYSDTAKIVDILLNGTKETLYVPNYRVGILQVRDKDTANKTSYLYLFNNDDSDTSTSTNLALDWGGFFNEGRKQVVEMLNKNADGSTNGLFTTPVVNTSVETDKDYVPVLIPNLRAYVAKLKRTTLAKPELKFSVLEMANKIAQVNAALSTFGLVNEITSRVKKASLDTTEQKEVFIAFVDEIEKTKNALRAEIKKVYKEDKDILQKLLEDVNNIENEAKKQTLR